MFAIGPGIGEHLHVDRAQHPVLVRAEPHFDAHFVAGEGGLEDFAAGEGEPRRPAGLHGDHRDVGLDVDVLFPAESSSDPRLHDADLAEGHLECPPKKPARMPGVLRRSHDDEPALHVEIAEGSVRSGATCCWAWV